MKYERGDYTKSKIKSKIPQRGIRRVRVNVGAASRTTTLR